jgi:ribonucleoside-diphosphate reductase alpha chain
MKINSIAPEILEFFSGDKLAAETWNNKYKFNKEKTPADMFKRHIKEIALKESSRLIELSKNNKELSDKLNKLSEYGHRRFASLLFTKSIESHLEEFLNFNSIVLAGGMMQGLGNHYLYSSLSNCFVLGQPHDSYSGINFKEDENSQVMKRRGGAGLDLSTIRPNGAIVHNQSGTSSGIVLFAEGYSNKTKQVAQYGRRGALMLSVAIEHPDSLEFIESKQDLTKITGANISVKISDEFMFAVEHKKDYILRFPVESSIENLSMEDVLIDYNILHEIKNPKKLDNHPKYIKRVKAIDLWNRLIECAWATAEPGILFVGNWKKHGTDWFYEQYRPVSTNPCSEIPMQPYDACRLLSTNVYRLVDNPFTDEAELNLEKIYSTFYEQLIIADLLVDLELDYIQRIIDKIQASEDPEHLKLSEISLWEKIADTCKKGRRCGCGFTGLGDMMAALNKPYTSEKEIQMLFKLKLKAELDATTDLAILLGHFDGFDPSNEIGFMDFVKTEFPTEYAKMMKYGRRNISWSTGAPTGTTSLMTQTTSGIEPVFKAFYKRRKKCILPTDRVDYIDPADGQKFSEYFVLHPQFKFWLTYKLGMEITVIDNLSEDTLTELFSKSPWYGQQAEDLDWKSRIKVQSIVQKYTTHAISSTINLPEDCKQELIGKIYWESWKSGLKGNTVYRDGSRAGILVSSTSSKEEKTPLRKRKRPRCISGNYHTIKYNGSQYSVIIGFLDNSPIEIFIVSGLDNLPEVLSENEYIRGTICKDTKEWYNFVSDTFILREITDMEHDEKLLSLMLSGLLRSETPLKTIIKILIKTKPIAGSFTHKLVKILSRYMVNGEESGDKCPDCSSKLIYEDGCVKCVDCGWTQC